MIKTCAYCKEEFDAKRIDKNYCSASCRQLNHLQRKAVELFGVTVKEENVKASIDTSGEYVKTGLPETPKQEERNPGVELKKEREYKFMPSKFVEEVGTLYKARSLKHTHNFLSSDKLINKNLEWVNIRIRCLIEAVLFISERNSISLTDLIELTNSLLLISQYEKLSFSESKRHSELGATSQEGLKSTSMAFSTLFRPDSLASVLAEMDPRVMP